MSWTWDAAAGVYKDHFLSSDIREAAVADSHFMKFLSPEAGFGKGKGGTANITRVHNLPLAGRVSESDRLPTGKPLVDTVAVSVSEWGYKVPMTELEMNLTNFDIRSKTHRALRDQMRLTMDKMASDAMRSTVYKVISSSATAFTEDTDGTASSTATNNLTVKHLGGIFDVLHGTLKCPTWKNGRYIGILSTKAARGIKVDADLATWYAPTGRDPIAPGGSMLPDIQGFDLYVTNHYDALDNSIGTAGVTGEAVFFGADAAFLAVVQDPELRAGPKDDLGRFQEVGWVGTLEAGLPWNSASQARIVHWASDV